LTGQVSAANKRESTGDFVTARNVCRVSRVKFDQQTIADNGRHRREVLHQEKDERTTTTTANLDFSHSSRKCWCLIRRLEAAQQPAK